MSFTESTYESAVIELFTNMGWPHIYVPDLNRKSLCNYPGRVLWLPWTENGTNVARRKQSRLKIASLLLKMWYSSLEIMHLGEIWDTLLPRLMSGEIDIFLPES